jgi:hypothetical protein
MRELRTSALCLQATSALVGLSHQYLQVLNRIDYGLIRRNKGSWSFQKQEVILIRARMLVNRCFSSSVIPSSKRGVAGSDHGLGSSLLKSLAISGRAMGFDALPSSSCLGFLCCGGVFIQRGDTISVRIDIQRSGLPGDDKAQSQPSNPPIIWGKSQTHIGDRYLRRWSLLPLDLRIVKARR